MQASFAVSDVIVKLIQKARSELDSEGDLVKDHLDAAQDLLGPNTVTLFQRLSLLQKTFLIKLRIGHKI